MDPFVAEIRIFPFNFPPTGWAWCDGQLLPISQNTALFSLLGTFYGGDGKSTFALPNLQGRVPLHQGQAPGLSSYYVGQAAGSETVTLLESELPNHLHQARAVSTEGSTTSAEDRFWAVPRVGRGTESAYTKVAPTVPMSDAALMPAGGSLPHNNLPPYLTFYYCIALQGVFPQRN
ncbi:MAG TPA: tail fiber protein [Terrimesophilobacter sp.]|uniref:phage tail protein n=1 Tax=Terrimesophilobacter sp. TaxID=2906435 RepID=UPI002F92E00A